MSARRLLRRRRAVVQVPPLDHPALQTNDEYSQHVEWLKWEAVEKVAAQVDADPSELWKAREYLLELVPLKRRGRPRSLKAKPMVEAARVVNKGGSLNKAAKKAGITPSTLKAFVKTNPETWKQVCELVAIKPKPYSAGQK